jgi:peptidoglycan/LPS O-acetylase OafA/YrhL
LNNVNSSSLKNINKLDSINLMRGIAILMVIMVHVYQGIDGILYFSNFARYGQMGVQLFFIASAFTLCYSMEAKGIRKGSIRNFYLRRFFRIAPVYYFGITLYCLVTLLLPYGWDSNKNPIAIIANIFFVNGLYPAANNNVVPGGWSIGTEMLFYLIFPSIFIGYNRLQNKYKWIYLVLPFIVLAFSLLIEYIIYSLIKIPSYFRNNSFLYFSLLNQFPVFFLGISLYTAYKKNNLQKINKFLCILLFIIFSYIAGFLMINGSTYFILSVAIFPFISGLSFIFLFVVLQYSNIKRLILSKIGIISYSSYLIHFIFAFYLTKGLSKIFSFIQADIQLIVLYCITVLLTFFAATFLYKYIEIHGVKLGKRIIEYLDQDPNEDTKLKRKYTGI